MNRHPWACAGGKGELELEAPMMDVVQTHIVPDRDAVDDDVLRAMCSLGCFKEKDKLMEALMDASHNTGKREDACFFFFRSTLGLIHFSR